MFRSQEATSDAITYSIHLFDMRTLLTLLLGLAGGAVGALLMIRVTDAGPTPAPSAAVSPGSRGADDRMLAALQALRGSLEALRQDLATTRLGPMETRSALGNDRPESPAGELDGPLLIETLQKLTRALDRITPGTQVPAHPAQALPQAGAQEEVGRLNQEMIATSHHDVLARFGRPSQILPQPDGSTWVYRDPQEPRRIRLFADFTDGILRGFRLAD